MIIDFIVLACSHKYGGRCLAGIDLTHRKLIRLISNDTATYCAIPTNFCYYNGIELEPLVKINVNLIEKAPDDGAQTENYYVSFPLILRIVGKATLTEIEPFEYQIIFSPLPFGTIDEYLNGDTYKYLTHSLCLIFVHNISIENTYNDNGEPKTKVEFDVFINNDEAFKNERYSVTDPRYIIYKDNSTNRMKKTFIESAYLLISLGPADGGSNYYSKYVSGIIDATNP